MFHLITFLILWCNSFIHSMHNEPFPLLEGEEIIVMGNKQEDQDCTVHLMTIHKTGWDNAQERTMYYHKNATRLLIGPDLTIAPEPFCKKIARLAQEYSIEVSIIPCVNDNSDKFTVASDRSGRFYFSEEYVNDENAPYLRFMIGHELGHRQYTLPQEDYDCYKKYESLSKDHLPFQCVTSSILLTGVHYFFSSPYIYYPLFAYYGFTVCGTAAVMCALYKSVKASQKIEFKCDEIVIETFGRTEQEKIEIAQEGIDLFSHDIRTNAVNKMMDFLDIFFNNFKSHPSACQRIRHLESIIKNIH